MVDRFGVPTRLVECENVLAPCIERSRVPTVGAVLDRVHANDSFVTLRGALPHSGCTLLVQGGELQKAQEREVDVA